ncbi:MAG: hypothetical protein SF069_16940 [Phycisphaerae bacterium]|nr:hypothetical protein [Phycisphaerae bacterium]
MNERGFVVVAGGGKQMAAAAHGSALVAGFCVTFDDRAPQRVEYADPNLALRSVSDVRTGYMFVVCDGRRGRA